MPTYAKDTQVPPARSRAEIEQTLRRYGADAFSYGYDEARATILFRAHGRHVRFDVPLPAGRELTHNAAGAQLGAEQRRGRREKLERQRWRALALVVKAKLEAVEAGIVGFEEEFLAHIMLPDGSTTYDWMGPQLDDVYESGQMPELLPPARAALGSGA